jgi:cellulose synthase/poly-beta-1,6-N-acetylglucosamine synthase-like glycosyltransferase
MKNSAWQTPAVLVQIPVYNEGWEVKNAALAVMKQIYQRNNICLQIVDDSPVHLPELVEFLEGQAAEAGIRFQYLYRPGRKGYKSGALNYGMRFCDHGYIVILDADFIIRPDFLQSTVPYMEDKALAGVQTRWTYRNQFASPTATIQSTIFETIFTLEQAVRRNLRIPAFFTGTSALWRRSVIEEVGGWKEEPFTAEDIDISFRSYHLGYSFSFLDRDLSTCEASPDFMAFKKQQQRWARGVFQAGVDNLSGVFTAAQSLRSKILEISTVFFNLLPLVLLLSGVAASIYIITGQERTLTWKAVEWITGLGILFGPTSLGIGYAVKKYHSMHFREMLKLLQSSFLGISLAWPMLFGIWEVITRSRKEFVVTPKGTNAFDKIKNRKPSQSQLIVLLELSQFLYFILLIVFYGAAYPESIALFSILGISGLASFLTSLRSKHFSDKLLKQRI